jgi:hypothetical protein
MHKSMEERFGSSSFSVSDPLYAEHHLELSSDYAFALIIGILFQYWSIAPMSGDYGMKTVVRAAKADFLSLTFFEIGLFGWMAIFQLAIFKSR